MGGVVDFDNGQMRVKAGSVGISNLGVEVWCENGFHWGFPLVELIDDGAEAYIADVGILVSDLLREDGPYG